jgi:phosphohistidine phosphatase SixA
VDVTGKAPAARKPPANAHGARSRLGRVLLVRHADAGERAQWIGPDRDRPLSAPGRAQSELLAASLARNPVERLVSSGYVRCVETFVPLGARLGLLTETASWLEEGADPEKALAALLVGGSVAACSHGDVVSGILFELAERGIALGSSPRMQKGSTWVLDVQDGRVTSARYLPPPD